MMQIVEVTQFNRNKVWIRTDNEIAFVMYKGDLSKYNLYVEQKLSEEAFHIICNDCLLPRAKRRGLFLLEKREYSVYLMQQKLLKDGYPEPVVMSALDYLCRCSYLDDERYTKAFLRTYSFGKSMNRMQMQLRQNGISEECIRLAVAELEANEDLVNERDVIYKLLRKRHYMSSDSTREEREKQIRYLLNKGFSYDIIKDCIENYIE